MLPRPFNEQRVIATEAQREAYGIETSFGKVNAQTIPVTNNKQRAHDKTLPQF